MPRHIAWHSKIIEDRSLKIVFLGVAVGCCFQFLAHRQLSQRTPVSAARAPVDGARALGGAAGIGAAKRCKARGTA